MGREHGGNLSYWNMVEFRAGMIATQISEYTLYTDSRIIGEYDCPTCPYRFMNMIPLYNEPGEIQEAITLRVSWVVSGEREFGVTTNITSYHGGWATDELAALASLRLGIRLKAGGETRIFGAYSEDPLGTPIASRKGKPDVFMREKRLIIPSVYKDANLESLKAIETLKGVSEAQFTALVRSARQFQNAIWIAESEPELAWLMLVSAIETAADEWVSSFSTRATPEEILREVKPEFSHQILESGGQEVHKIVANELARNLQATKKFLAFSIDFLPQPPQERPPEHAQIAWEKKSIKKILNKIYDYRSSALHAGIPIPAPLCSTPWIVEMDKPYAEVGTLGLAAHTLGASWKADDLPISLNTFCYLVRGILINWWDSITAVDLSAIADFDV
jgi:hypothetical protein